MSRVIRAPIEKVWQAHTDPEVMRQWLTGADGRSMTTCEWTAKAGESYRFKWEREDGSQPFEMSGEVREVKEPHRLVTTERMFGENGPEQVQVLTLAPHGDGTMLTEVHTFPHREARDQGLDSRLVEMESTYARLEELLS
ncbi:SRPBCC domain-containing protein [Jatrophihabitans sp.]|uniref:SRPBCC domain-containing protein n=1 Tax=Jatrophihabitans sp. TaxID=1932789 RepID=UPI002BB04F3B|nr:SRPBCC domain-containing protein [Jatrophihabitans sp.]